MVGEWSCEGKCSKDLYIHFYPTSPPPPRNAQDSACACRSDEIPAKREEVLTEVKAEGIDLPVLRGFIGLHLRFQIALWDTTRDSVHVPYGSESWGWV